MTLLRYGIPAVMFIAGFIVLFVAGSANAVEGWAMLVGAAIAQLAIVLFWKIGASGEDDRRREEEARRFFTEHGHWPDEPPRASR